MPVPKRMNHTSQKVCIVGEIQNNVASMLRAQTFSSSPHKPQQIAEPQHVEGPVLNGIGLFTTKHPKSAKTTARLTYLGFRFRVSDVEDRNEKLFEFAMLQRVVEGNTGMVL
jgi:hypothetical protein